RLQKVVGLSKKKCETVLGDVFYMNSISNSIRLAVGNPLVVKNLHFYPCYHVLSPSQFYHAKKWQSSPVFQAPMVRTDHGDFFITEIA
ncbi:hypothetical protein DFS34DRAFT_561725, partial [Phlyctochytrium arcticum]